MMYSYINIQIQKHICSARSHKPVNLLLNNCKLLNAVNDPIIDGIVPNNCIHANIHDYQHNYTSIKVY